MIADILPNDTATMERLSNGLGWPSPYSGQLVSRSPSPLDGSVEQESDRVTRKQEQAIHRVEEAAEVFNQALLEAAIEGVVLKVENGTGPYRTGPTNSTNRAWVRVKVEGSERRHHHVP